MSLTRLVTAVALAAGLSLGAGCGSSTTDSGAGPLADSVSPTTPAVTPTTAPASPAPATPASTTAVPTKASSRTPTGGDGDAAGDNAPSTAGGGVCSHLGAQQVGAVLGVAVRGTAVPGETGCKFDQGGAKGMSVTVLDKTTAQAGGMDGAKSEANSAVEGQPQDVAGIGSAAFVVTGSMFGGPDVNAAGAVQVGGRIVSVYLAQHSGLAEAKVRAMELDLLRLVAKARA